MFLCTLTLSTLAAAGCSAGGGGMVPDAHPVDAYEVSLDLPPGCPPAAGNEKSVGKPCTQGGKECGSLQCTCDPFVGVKVVGIPCFCTLVTLNSNPDAGDLCAALDPNFCGSNAGCCSYLTIGTYCAPEICLPGGVCPAVSVGQP
jgi:hypothetical protein